jgi:hypothetical protein
MSGEPDYLAAALHFAGRARRFLNDAERARFYEVARQYQTLAIAEGKRFVRDMPKRPAAPSVRRYAAARRRPSPRKKLRPTLATPAGASQELD